MSTSNGSSSPLTPHLGSIEDWVRQNWTNAQIVEGLRSLGVTTTEGSVRRAKRRIGIPSKPAGGPSFKQSGDEAEIDSGKVEELPSPEDLMKIAKLDPNEWTYDDPDIGWWGSPDNRFYSMKLRLKRKVPLDFILPARSVGYKPPRIQGIKRESGPELWVFPGDQQCPYESIPFHNAFLSFLAEERPDRGCLMGDGTDNPNLSSHRTNPAWNATFQECLDRYHEVLCDYRSASPITQYKKLFGNHEWRLQRLVLDKVSQLYGLRAANAPESHSVLSMTHLLRLDELEIEVVEPIGEYTHAQVQIAPDLIARHGWLTGPNAMNKALSGLTCSVIYGHVHSAASKSGTRWTPEGAPQHVHAFENGTMCEIRGGQGFAVDTNWSPCFSTVEVWPDGKWHHDFARFNDGKLYWRNKRY